MGDDPRRGIPRTDDVLASPAVSTALRTYDVSSVRRLVTDTLTRARSGELAPEDVLAAVEQALAARSASPTTLRPLLNATGVVLHTNLGRAPLSAAAVQAVTSAAGYVDVEYDVATGVRASRGRGTLAALREAVPDAGDALVVNNGAAALMLATMVLAQGRDLVVSRGEMVEIGDGFRLPDLIASTGVRLREVGTTNRTTVADYAAAIGPETGAILKVHPSNFRITGFTAEVGVADLAGLGVPVIMDIGSGLLRPDPSLPEEPDATTQLRAGATLVTCSGDKLLAGPQAGLVLGDAGTVRRVRCHPMQRALRVDKITLAALEATLRGPVPPATRYRQADIERLRARAEALAAVLAEPPAAVPAEPPARLGGDVAVVPSAGAVGGGSAPDQPLPGWAVAVPEQLAAPLRRAGVIARVERGRCLLDLRCIPEAEDDRLAAIVAAVAGEAR